MLCIGRAPLASQSDHLHEMKLRSRIESDAMKRLYTLCLCTIAAMGSLFVIFNPIAVSAETSQNDMAEQAQITTLVTMAIPPYKW
ncbi:hypothetical protein HEAR0907 [Herminiimonas arsenicoxydans]|uniref:Uncharacterized protein n=1 Tax=Herminiimonas arsenicoxydans TaxID=204773 RepID=A4G3K4_HERAR|nr:hypothetical protein HEAR0907 [Herminiimonas arsenicoxydans]